MDEDTEQAAWHQLELENWQRLLTDDPEYPIWLNTANHTKEHDDEVSREAQ